MPGGLPGLEVSPAGFSPPWPTRAMLCAGASQEVGAQEELLRLGWGFISQVP